MVQNQTLLVKDEIAYSSGFIKAKKEKKLSAITNELWKSYFDISKQEAPSGLSDIEDELRKLAAREAFLKDKKESIIKKQEADKPYKVISSD